ncbi:MAG: hypothetical protein H0V58_03130 [Actinobacteria bacterium]|nr:hypothetical protein [Actinomycetota bacterium]
MLRPLGVTGSFTGEHEDAADIGKRLEGGGLTARRRCHRLVQMPEPDVHLPEGHLGKAELGQRSELEVRVSRLERDREGVTGEPGGLFDVTRTLGAGEVEPSLLCPRGHVSEKTLGTRQPATCRGVVAENKRVLSGEPERDPCSAGEIAVAAKPSVGALAVDDRGVLLPQPPERAAETVERLRRLHSLQSACEPVARVAPFSRGE